MISIENIRDIVSFIQVMKNEHRNHEWIVAKGQPCVHTFVGDIYIEMCKYTREGKMFISVDIDDTKGQADVMHEEFSHETSNDMIMSELSSLYSSVRDLSKSISVA